MQAEILSTKQLLLEIEKLRLEVEELKREKSDLEILLDTTTAHADTVEFQLHESNKRLQAEIVERQHAEAVLQAFAAKLQSVLAMINREKADLEILLETTTEHGDIVEYLLYDKAEEAVRKSERHLSQFLEAVPVGVFVLDANGKPYYANRTALQILGEEVLTSTTSKEWTEACPIYLAGTNQPYPRDRQPSLRALNGESTITDDIEIHRGDEVIPLECRGTPIFDEKGNIAYALIAFQDITERKRAEAESINFTHELYRLNEAYHRFVPRQFLEFLNKESIVDVQLGDQVQQEMSILFADIRDFTTLSESMTPHENFKFINAYLSRMEPMIIQNQGFIDKYIGDGIMALFSGGADNAVKAGIAMLKTLTEYNQHRTNVGYVPIQVGIGINTGSLMLGTVGGSSRMDSTVISDAVNLASRLEGLTKCYGTSLLISHYTFSQLQDANEYAFRIINRVQVKGKLSPVTIYEVFDADLPEIRDGKLATKKEFEQALLLYNQQLYRQAAQLFQHCLRLNPKDRVAQIYLETCQKQW